MPHIPNQPVPWRVEHMVQGDRELHHAEPGPKVAAGDRNRTDVSERNSSASCRSDGRAGGAGPGTTDGIQKRGR